MTNSLSHRLARTCRGILTALTLMTTALCVYAQPDLEKSDVVYFRLGSSVYEPEFKENGARLEAFLRDIEEDRQSGLWEIVAVDFSAGASPDGPSWINTRLAKARLATMTELLRGRLSPTSSRSTAFDWKSLSDTVSRDSAFPGRDEVLAIMGSSSLGARGKEAALKRIGGGRAWKYLELKYLPDQRAFRISVRRRASKLPGLSDSQFPADVAEFSSSRDLANSGSGSAPRSGPQEGRFFRLKTNIPELFLLSGNVAAEIDLFGPVSLHFPVHYTALDWFRNTVKFRNFAIQPELRYNFSRVRGLFAGAHFGLAWFNVATGGDWRYQDKDGHSPLMGGGLGIGYRLPLGSGSRWELEFSLGAGVYSIDYDRFYNEPGGAWAGSGSTTWAGLDNACISITYKFPLR